ncbi:MAG: chemotaxis protein CheW [Planctomycetia bacterium]|jgi:chemotaxis-related protein WspD
MTAHAPDHADRRAADEVRQPMPECWRIVGVAGDRSCPELATAIHCRNCPVLAEAARTFFERSAPAGYLDDWRAILEEPSAPPAADSLSVLLFRVAGEWLAISTPVLVEVTPVRALHRLPHRAGPILAGLVNIRGQIQLCGSLHGLLGLAGGPARPADAGADAGTARLLVVERAVETGAERWVLGVDEVAGVQRIPRSALRPVPSTVGQAGSRCSSALFDWQDRTVALIDEPRMFDALRAAVAE